MLRHRAECVTVLLVVLGLFWPGWACAWEQYDQGCKNCHNFFSGSPALHNTHIDLIAVKPGMAECQLCHRPSPEFHTLLTYRSGGGLVGPERSDQGCTGCHGRDYGDTHPVDSLPWSRGFGLRKHHMNHGPPVCSASCHVNDPTPLGESSAPVYYSRSDLAVALDPCDGSEDQAAVSHTVSLDNDGDGLYDAGDPDCSAEPCDPPPGVVANLMVVKPNVDDARCSWGATSDAGLYRVYSVSSKAAMSAHGPPRGDNLDPSNQLRCETPDASTLTCDHPGALVDPDGLLCYQVVSVCADDHLVEGGS